MLDIPSADFSSISGDVDVKRWVVTRVGLEDLAARALSPHTTCSHCQRIIRDTLRQAFPEESPEQTGQRALTN